MNLQTKSMNWEVFIIDWMSKKRYDENIFLLNENIFLLNENGLKWLDETE